MINVMRHILNTKKRLFRGYLEVKDKITAKRTDTFLGASMSVWEGFLWGAVGQFFIDL
jgi:hypothetical protein